MKHAAVTLLALSLFICVPVLGDEPVADASQRAAGLKLFEAKIRPVLIQQCYACHSADAVKAGKLQGELLLDTRAGIRKGGESGPAVVPGDVEQSLILGALRHDNFKMPPDTKLPAAVIDDFVAWVKLGAPDPREGESHQPAERTIDLAAGRTFWSFQPLHPAPVPTVKQTSWVRTSVDPFILARLEQQDLSPNAAADSQTLIRRLYFDVWGLPPEPSEVQTFLADDSPQAYEQLVDRLLEGQHYGERWARHWLDLARFAESNGYAFDKDRPAAYHYRDFVIKALNEDLPYDQFVRWQVAGDQIAPQDYMAQAATGFLAAGPFTSQQTQKERERSRYEQLDDIVGTLGTAMLGLTIGCARCHDHKFDPLPTRDYYRITSCFAETGFQDYDYDPDPAGTRAAQQAFDAAHKPLVDARVAFEKEHLPARLAAWEQSKAEPPARETLGVWHVMGPFPAASFAAAYKQAFPPEKKVDLQRAEGELRWVPQPTWKDGQVHNTLSGDNSANYLFRTIEVATKGPLEISLGRDDAIKVWLNGKSVLAKEVSGAAAPDQDKVTLQLNAGRNELLVKIVNGGGPSGFYFSTRPTIPANIQAILKVAAEKRNDKQRQELTKWFAPRDPDWGRLNQAEQTHLKEKPQPKITKVLAARKNGATYNFGADTRKVYFLARGNSNSKQGLATPGFLRVLTSAETDEQHWLVKQPATDKPTSQPARVALAHWLTDVDSGAGQLLARVIVNRLWQHHFGRGIVATPSDFGSQGAAPTHPLLLDHLANQLIENGWRLKPIHKLILMSAAYRQDGTSRPREAQADPDNLLCWHHAPQRLEAEVIRDTLLSVSGSLDKKMFGKGSLNQTDARRSVYLTVKRSNLIPILQLFDAPDSIQSIGNRDITTVPPQALAMMNSPLVRQLAEKFATRLGNSEEKSYEQLVQEAYMISMARPPSESEQQQMVAFIQSQAASYGADKAHKQRALADFCQLMFCLNEFVFVD